MIKYYFNIKPNSQNVDYGWNTFNPEATNELNFSNIIFSIKEILFSRSKLFPNESLTNTIFRYKNWKFRLLQIF